MCGSGSGPAVPKKADGNDERAGEEREEADLGVPVVAAALGGADDEAVGEGADGVEADGAADAEAEVCEADGAIAESVDACEDLLEAGEEEVGVAVYQTDVDGREEDDGGGEEHGKWSED